MLGLPAKEPLPRATTPSNQRLGLGLVACRTTYELKERDMAEYDRKTHGLRREREHPPWDPGAWVTRTHCGTWLRLQHSVKDPSIFQVAGPFKQKVQVVFHPDEPTCKRCKKYAGN